LLYRNEVILGLYDLLTVTPATCYVLMYMCCSSLDLSMYNK
jgi:hypothetical protein